MSTTKAARESQCLWDVHSESPAVHSTPKAIINSATARVSSVPTAKAASESQCLWDVHSESSDRDVVYSCNAQVFFRMAQINSAAGLKRPRNALNQLSNIVRVPLQHPKSTQQQSQSVPATPQINEGKELGGPCNAQITPATELECPCNASNHPRNRVSLQRPNHPSNRVRVSLQCLKSPQKQSVLATPQITPATELDCPCNAPNKKTQQQRKSVPTTPRINPATEKKCPYNTPNQPSDRVRLSLQHPESTQRQRKSVPTTPRINPATESDCPYNTPNQPSDRVKGPLNNVSHQSCN